MNAIRPGRGAAAAVAFDLLADRAAEMRRRLAEQDGLRISSEHITLHIRPGATAEERQTIAALLLRDAGARIVTEDHA